MIHWRIAAYLIMALLLCATAHAQEPPLGVSGGPAATELGTIYPGWLVDGDPNTVWVGDANATAWSGTYGMWTGASPYGGSPLAVGIQTVRVVFAQTPPAQTLVECKMPGAAWIPSAYLPAGALDSTVTINRTCVWVRVSMSGAPRPYIRDFFLTTGDVPATPPPPATPPGGSGGGGSTPPPPSPPPSAGCVNVSWGAANTVAVVGDSITQGVGREKPSYVDLLPEWRPDLVFFNQGQGGDMTQHVLNRMASITATGARTYFVMIGGNDVQNANPLAEIMARIGQIVDALHCAGGAVVLIGPTPRYATLAPALQAYDAALAAYAAAHGVAYFPAWNAVADGNVIRADLTDDGTHLNMRGRRFLSRGVAHGAGWTYQGD